jgi:ABC-type branched-subunit amino acid transport system substrate-binding protein/predicted negative regulator of RcsB-dependent stress response
MVFSTIIRLLHIVPTKDFMKIQNILFILLLFLVVLVQGMHTQPLQDSIVYKPDVEREFGKAMKLFRAGRFDTASAAFVALLKENPRSHRATGASIMGGKAFYELKNYRESLRLLKDLIDLNPQSSYIDDAHYTLGLNYYQMERFEDAALEFMNVVQKSSEQRLLSRSKKMLEMITSSNLTLEKLQLLQADATSDEMKALVTVRIAEKKLQTGDFAVAGEMLRTVSVMPPNIKYVAEALSLLEQMEKHGGVKIGAALPLMLKDENSTARALGIEFLQGIRIAVDEYNQITSVKIDLEVRDTERDPSLAARQVADLCSDEKVSAIIGPIISGEVFATAGIANERGVPLVTPTATANGIAAIGPFIFQANPDFDMRARSVAAFAYTTLGARKFAVLAPSDAVGKQMVESFIKEVDTLSGEMVDVQWYAAGTSDLRTEIMAIRRKALEKLEVPTVDFGGKMKQSELNKFVAWGVNQHVLDSLIERRLTAPVTFLFGERGQLIADSLQLKTRIEKSKYDSLGLPVSNIDAIFVPIASSEEIPVVSSQLKFFNIQAQVLGTGDWNDMSLLDQNRQYTEGTMFTADTYIDPANEAYRIFSAKYQHANNNLPPSINALLGYDVAKMIIQIFSQGKTRRTDVAAALANVKEFEGLHSKISLALNRVNSYLTILQYKNRQILRIGESDLTSMGK